MLFHTDYRILDCLSESGGFPTGDIAFLIHGVRDRSTSAVMSRELKALRTKGYVTELDDKKPVCWVRTPKGTEALRRKTGPSALPCHAGEVER